MTNETCLKVTACLYACPNCLKQSVPKSRIPRTHTNTHERIHSKKNTKKLLCAQHTCSIYLHETKSNYTSCTYTHTCRACTQHAAKHTLEIMSESLRCAAGPGELGISTQRKTGDICPAPIQIYVQYSCFVCSKACEYRTGKKILYITYVREKQRGRHGKKIWGERSQRPSSSQRVLTTN